MRLLKPILFITVLLLLASCNLRRNLMYIVNAHKVKSKDQQQHFDYALKEDKHKKGKTKIFWRNHEANPEGDADSFGMYYKKKDKKESENLFASAAKNSNTGSLGGMSGQQKTKKERKRRIHIKFPEKLKFFHFKTKEERMQEKAVGEQSRENGRLFKNSSDREKSDRKKKMKNREQGLFQHGVLR